MLALTPSVYTAVFCEILEMVMLWGVGDAVFSRAQEVAVVCHVVRSLLM